MNHGAVVVTGAAGSFGSHLVVDLLRRGERVVALGRSEATLRDAVDRAASRLGATWDPEALVLRGLALNDVEGWSQLLGELEEAGSVRGAVLAAGGWTGGRPFVETPESAWATMLDQNLHSARLALAQLVPVLVRRGGGSVVLVGSRAAVRPWESVGAAAYASAKAALVALGQTVAAEVLGEGVRVNVVLPSTLAAPDAAPPPPHLLSPASLAAVVRFLLSDDASAVSGAALPVYGPC